MTELLELAARAATDAGEWVATQRPTRVDHKGVVDLVTEVDLGSEGRIRACLADSGIPVQAEEGGGATGRSTRWIVDPLDGTTNFVHGFPQYCVSIALLSAGVLEIGVIYDIPRGLLYCAQRGHGATCQGNPISVSTVSTLDRALVASGFAYDRRDHPQDYLRFVERMLVESQGFRRAGSAALDLCHVAQGQIDAYWEFNLSAWDVAAGAVIVREAGGQVSDIDGGLLDIDSPRILATNTLLHQSVSDRLTPLLPLRPTTR